MPKTRRLSDATLVRRSQQGDRRAFSALLGRYDWRLRGLSHALLLDSDEMDTALGVAYLRAWRDVVRINAKDDVGAWLYRVTYNACIDQLRRTDDPGAARVGSEAGPGTDGVGAGLSTLSAADRVAVVLVDREGFSPASAARILGLTPPVLDSRLAAARRRLAAFLPPLEPDQSDSPDTEAHDPVATAPGETDAAHGNGQDPDAPRPGADTSGDVDDAGSGASTRKGSEPVRTRRNGSNGTTADPSGNAGASRPPNGSAAGATPPEATTADATSDDGATGSSDTTSDGGATNDSDAASPDEIAADASANDAKGPSTNGGGGRGRRARRRAQHAATRPASGSADRNGDTAP